MLEIIKITSRVISAGLLIAWAFLWYVVATKNKFTDALAVLSVVLMGWGLINCIIVLFGF